VDEMSETPVEESGDEERDVLAGDGGGSSSLGSIATGAADGLQPGMRVFHQKFGYGRVVAAESGKLEVEFEHGGLKHVMETFVEKA
jgi:hypothetical protein